MLSSTLQLSHHKTTVTDCFIYNLIIGRHPPSDLAATYRSGFLPGSQFSSIMQKKKSKINKVVTQTCRVSQMFWKKLRGRESIQPRKCSKNSLFFPNVYPPPRDVHLIFPLHHLFFKLPKNCSTVHLNALDLTKPNCNLKTKQGFFLVLCIAIPACSQHR